jgi:hypothetical protein
MLTEILITAVISATVVFLGLILGFALLKIQYVNN